MFVGGAGFRTTCTFTVPDASVAFAAGARKDTCASSSSVMVISPSPARPPVAPPPRFVAARVGLAPVEEAGIDTVTVLSAASASPRAASVSVASVALGVPDPSNDSVLDGASNVTPAGAPERARVKCVPASPPVNCKGAASASPSVSARLSVRVSVAVAAASSSVAVLSGVESVTVVASLSSTATSADAGLPTA